jgi:hypothetical protein
VESDFAGVEHATGEYETEIREKADVLGAIDIVVELVVAIDDFL